MMNMGGSFNDRDCDAGRSLRRIWKSRIMGSVWPLVFVAAPLSQASAGFAQTSETKSPECQDDSSTPCPKPTREEPTDEELVAAAMSRVHERVSVVGSSVAAANIPGSAYVLGPLDLEREKQGFDDIHRMLRRVPGVVIQEEEGYGLRPNIGMRGSGTERSSKITLMEDGVLIAPAPYAAPSAYYFPVAGRMESIEVRKGSSQIKFGPRTNGGVLNLVSTSIPQRLRLNTTLSLGGDSSRKLHANMGDAYENLAWMFETYQFGTDGYKEIDGGGTSGFGVHDYLGKIRLNSPVRWRVFQSVELKAGYRTQKGDETYLGLTDADFASNRVRRYAASQPDRIDWDHRQVQVQHFLATDRLDLTTTIYRNQFARNWYKLQSVLGTGIASVFEDPSAFSEHLSILRGRTSGPNDLEVRANDREYSGSGIQSALGFNVDTKGVQHNLELGFRLHADEEDRLQFEDGFQMMDGVMVLSNRGVPGSQSNRLSEADAVAVYLQDELSVGALTFSPGVRFEHIELRRFDFSRSDPSRTEGPTAVRTNTLDVLVPGIGVRYDATDAVQIFGGVHEGFSPPGPGSSEDTKAESSLNYELGVRERSDSRSVELIAFFNDYSNLLGADTLASGGTGEGDLFNGGEVDVFGVEASFSGDLQGLVGGTSSLPITVSYTYTNAQFRNDFSSGFDAWGDVHAGDRLPYLPPHQLFASAGASGQKWRFGLNAHLNARMRTRAGQGRPLFEDSIASYLVVNGSVEVDVAPQTSIFANVQNLTDRSYIVARRPAGVRPGLPRTFMVGVKFRLGS